MQSTPTSAGLFPAEHVVGAFRGASGGGGGGLEFHAQLTLHHRDGFTAEPMHGRFVVVELADEREAVLGRIASVASAALGRGAVARGNGLRMDFAHEELGELATLDERREHGLVYRVDVRMLGVLRYEGEELLFAPSHRRVPRVGARVAFLTDELLRKVAGGTRGTQIGHYALGEFVYCGEQREREAPVWARPTSPCVPVRFSAEQLVARRSFVFARAGFGKSNLVKLLFSGLYARPPRLRLQDGRKVPVGTVVFDPDGEYFWPDVHGHPALCDVESLRDEVVVFTNQEPPSELYGSFKAAGVRLDVRGLPARLVVSIALSPEQQQQQNVHKLRALDARAWAELVDLIHRDGINAPEKDVCRLLGLRDGQEMELYAARANMARIVHELHDPDSETLTLLHQALRDGKLCVVDVSRMRGAAGLALSGIVLRYIFNYNQEQFTHARPHPIPTIAVVEEAQAVLGSYGSGESAYEEWIKEGRKYSLGAVLITQQPGSIPHELLSQGDSWFVFHLLSKGDLNAVKAANSHFSDDLLSSLLNEPLPGNGVFWSSADGGHDRAGNAYPIPLRVLSFEHNQSVRDPRRALPAIDAYAGRLARLTRQAIAALAADEEVNRWLSSTGKTPWLKVQAVLENAVPPDALPDVKRWAYELVPVALTRLFGPQGEAWSTEQQPKRDDPKRLVRWVVVKRS